MNGQSEVNLPFGKEGKGMVVMEYIGYSGKIRQDNRKVYKVAYLFYIVTLTTASIKTKERDVTKMAILHTMQVEGTEKIVIEKKGKNFEFTEGLFNGYPEMKVTMNGETSSVSGIVSIPYDAIIFQYGIGGITGISSQGMEKTHYQKIKKMYQEIKNRADEMKKKEEDEKYAPLCVEMKKIAMPKNNENPDDEKCRELLKKAEANSFHSEDPEDSGINLASASHFGRIVGEAEKLCNHSFKIHFWRTHTGDARLKLERDISCDKCGFQHRDSVEENLSEEAMWR